MRNNYRTNNIQLTMTVAVDKNETPKKECRPLNVFTSIFITIMLLSVVWVFYSVAIEILKLQTYHDTCPLYNTIQNNWTSDDNTICKNYLDSLRSIDTIGSSFWSLIITSGMSPWIVLCLVAIITSNEKVPRNHKEGFWFLLGMLIAIYFVSLIVTSFAGPQVYLYASPAYLGVPLIIIIPGIVSYMKYNNICKRALSIINPVTITIYTMIVVSFVILTSYLVWQPDTYKELLYKGGILIGCARFFAFLAALILSYEIHYVYTYDNYPKPQDYTINSVNKNQASVQHDLSDIENNNIEQEIIAAKVEYENNNKQDTEYIILGHILAFCFVLFITSWLSMSQTAANISILVLDSMFPMFAALVIDGQGPFNQYMISRNKN